MKTLVSKKQLLEENHRVRSQLDVFELYLTHAIRDEVTFFKAGDFKIGVCGETRAHGGIVMVTVKVDKKWDLWGVFYWDSWSTDRDHRQFDPQDLSNCIAKVRAHVNKVQHEFYAPRIAEAMQVR